MGLSGPAARARDDIARLSHAGLDSVALRTAIATRLQAVIPAHASGFVTVDPDTLLLTGSVRRNVPDEAVVLLTHNEYAQTDYNKISDLARRRHPVGRLSAETHGRLVASRRYREILQPLGWGDELRAVFRTGSTCWGFLCLHRAEADPLFAAEEARLLASLTGHVASGLRRSILIVDVTTDTVRDDGPGLVELTDALEVAAHNAAAERWLAELGWTAPWTRRTLPQVIYSLVAQMRATEAAIGSARVPTIRLRTQTGQWLALHASRLETPDGEGPISIIVQPGWAGQIAGAASHLHGLSDREAEVCRYVLRGLPTYQIADALCITTNTVQDHLKSIFEKTGVHSRQELTARLFFDYHAPPT